MQAFGDSHKSKFKDVLGDEGRAYLERMIGAASRMQELLEALRLYSRVKIRIAPFEPVDLIKVVQDTISDIALTIDAAGGQIEIGALPFIEADAAQLRQLFQNLIINSLKFCRKEEPPKIKSYGNVVGGTAQIFVKDNCIGFEERHAERIFPDATGLCGHVRQPRRDAATNMFWSQLE